ncbi:Uncharacterized protein PRO82_000157 [Candidatus Protochlamydia amoebophila]|nr:Uncharacterized protein [Candidatus Protochlamydia amoebophila]
MRVEFGETFEEAIRREIFEGLGCQITILNNSTVCSNIFEHYGIKEHEAI